MTDSEVFDIENSTSDTPPIELVAFIDDNSSGSNSLEFRESLEEHHHPRQRLNHAEATVKLPACIVQRANNIWVELRCPVCNCNATPTPGASFISGAMGFRAHLETVHRVLFDYLASEEVVDFCLHRSFSEQDIVAMIQGDLGAPSGTLSSCDNHRRRSLTSKVQCRMMIPSEEFGHINSDISTVEEGQDDHGSDGDYEDSDGSHARSCDIVFTLDAASRLQPQENAGTMV